MKTTPRFRSLFTILILSSTTAINAQSPVSPVNKGTITLIAGAGAGNEYNSSYNHMPWGTKAAIEKACWQAGPGVVTLGIQAGGTFSANNTADKNKAGTLIIAGRSAWHHGWQVKGLDTYAGVSAGAGFNRYWYYKNEDRIVQQETIPVFGGFIGASYFFTPALGINLEAGSDITRIQAGIVLKLK